MTFEAQKGSIIIALPVGNVGTRSGWGVNATPRPLHSRERNPVPIVQEAGWAPGPVWKDAEKKSSAPIGVWTPNRQARSEPLLPTTTPRFPKNYCSWRKLMTS
jgi:hypothetical protein